MPSAKIRSLEYCRINAAEFTNNANINCETTYPRGILKESVKFFEVTERILIPLHTMCLVGTKLKSL